MSTSVAVTESVTTVTDNTSYVSVLTSPAVTTVVISTGPVTIGGSSYAIQSGSGTPVGVITPEFAGQLYFDNDTGQTYVSSAATNTSWIELVRNY